LGFENFQKMVGFACAAPTLLTDNKRYCLVTISL